MNGTQFASIGGSYSTSFIGSWSLLSQNIAGNYSVIRLYATFRYGGGSSVGSSYSTFQLNGTTVKTGSYRYNSGDTQLGYTDITVYHNADGTFPTQTVSINVNSYHMKNKSASGTISGVATIPRASSISVSASSVTMGNTLNISINRASGNFYHTLTYKFGGATGTIGTEISTSKSWSVPLDLANQIPNSTSGVGTIYCYTYNNGTHIGTYSVNFTATVPSNIVPSFNSLSIQRIDNTVPKDWGLYVKTKSSCVANINGAKGSYGSSISAYSITGGGYSCSSDSLATGILNNAGTITFTAKVTDSRGRTATKTQSITVVDYSGPNIQSVISQRCLKNGTINDDGTYAKCKAITSYSNCNNQNTLTEKVYFKKSGTENWSSETPFTNEVVIGNAKIDVDYSYDIKYEVSDTFTTVIFMDSISTAYSTVDYKKGGKGIAFGKVSEKDGFECAMDTEFTKKVNFQDEVTINGNPFTALGAYPVGAIYISFDNTSPEKLFGGKWERIVDHFLWCQDDNEDAGRTGGLSRVTLAQNEMPVHTHIQNEHNHSAWTGTSGNHNHSGRFLGFTSVTYAGGGGWQFGRRITGSDSYNNDFQNTYDAGNHTHGVGIGNTTAINNNTGGGESHENMPPWISVNAWKRIA